MVFDGLASLVYAVNRFVSLWLQVVAVTECPMSNRCGGNQDHWVLTNPPPVTSQPSLTSTWQLNVTTHCLLYACYLGLVCISYTSLVQTSAPSAVQYSKTKQNDDITKST